MDGEQWGRERRGEERKEGWTGFFTSGYPAKSYLFPWWRSTAQLLGLEALDRQARLRLRRRMHTHTQTCSHLCSCTFISLQHGKHPPSPPHPSTLVQELHLTLHTACQHFINKHLLISSFITRNNWPFPLFFLSFPLSLLPFSVRRASFGLKLNHSCFITCQHLSLVFFSSPSSQEEIMPRARKGCTSRGVQEEQSLWWAKEDREELCIFHCSNHRCYFNAFAGNDEKTRAGVSSPPPFFHAFIWPPGVRSSLSICLQLKIKPTNPPLHCSIWCSHPTPRQPLAGPTRLSPHAQRPLSQYILLQLLHDSSKI